MSWKTPDKKSKNKNEVLGSKKNRSILVIFFISLAFVFIDMVAGFQVGLYIILISLAVFFIYYAVTGKFLIDRKHFDDT